jgi:hypothetical protein
MYSTGTPVLNPVSAAWNTVARFDDYQAAQRAVDELADEGFPVHKLDIIGSDLRLVERVTGRLTKARAAGAGAITGMWAGLLIGLLLGLFTTGHTWLGVVLAAAGFGALWGAVFGFAAHAATRGQRDFSSIRGLSATRYDLIARDGTMERARHMLDAAGLLPAPDYAAPDYTAPEYAAPG